MNLSTIPTLHLALLALIAAQQAADVYTTKRVLDLGGRERNKLVQAVMARIGVLPALVLLKSAATVVAAYIVFAAAKGQASPLHVTIGLAVIVAVYGYVLAGNFKALREQKAIAAARALREMAAEEWAS